MESNTDDVSAELEEKRLLETRCSDACRKIDELIEYFSAKLSAKLSELKTPNDFDYFQKLVQLEKINTDIIEQNYITFKELQNRFKNDQICLEGFLIKKCLMIIPTFI